MNTNFTPKKPDSTNSGFTDLTEIDLEVKEEFDVESFQTETDWTSSKENWGPRSKSKKQPFTSQEFYQKPTLLQIKLDSNKIELKNDFKKRNLKEFEIQQDKKKIQKLSNNTGLVNVSGIKLNKMHINKLLNGSWIHDEVTYIGSVSLHCN
ncbi:unnamed protein product [Brachionus calyciflorus]|uniref:Uncharacterized protein n=1 Tax=Brachionus calyciflorus TaxID=104777 RepID=A0A814IN17_9BILA|nr:unnamed protein product [Brachionus calyciflorus]